MASSSTCPFDDVDVWASAPGRVEFIGNHTDYNGGWVLGATIDRRVDVGLRLREDDVLVLRSAQADAGVRVPLNDIEAQSGDQAWANYVLGVLVELQAAGVEVDRGMELQIQSTVPVGAGLSSSAALELATARAVVEAAGEDLPRTQLAQLCRRAENEFVGVPCGILDQAVVAFGDEDRLVRVDARTDSVTSVPFPSRTQIWIFRTHQAHALADAHYQERHDEARAARDRLDDVLGGVEHLVDVPPDRLEEVQSDLSDVLYRRARHVSTEHRRVERAVRLLHDEQYAAVGDLLFASHESSRTDYENSTEELDFVVERLKGVDSVLGARLTGAGFGGAAMAWTQEDFGRAAAEAVAAAYADEFGAELEVLACRPAPGVFARSASV
ncbi:MAG: galactokinase [Salinivenus sp.]